MLLKELILEQTDKEYQQLLKWAEENKDIFSSLYFDIKHKNITSVEDIGFKSFEEFLNHFNKLKNNIEYERNYKENIPKIDYDKIAKEAKKILGMGQQAIAYDKASSENIGQIVKLLYIASPFTISKDSYVEFLRYALKSNNPYFPKVYTMKEYNNSETDIDPFEDYAYSERHDGYPYVVYMEMEKLYKLRNKHLIDTVIEKMKTLGFPNPRIEYNKIYIGDRYIENFFQSVDNIRTIINNTKDENLKEALSYVIKEMEDSEFRKMTDMHVGNIMVRLTSTGPQLVFIDPFI